MRKYCSQSDAIFLRAIKCCLITVKAAKEVASNYTSARRSYRECLRSEYLNVGSCSSIFLVSISAVASYRLLRDGLRSANDAKPIFSCRAEKVLESIPHLCYKEVSSPASPLDSRSTRKFIERFCWSRTTIALLRKAAHLHTNCLLYNLSLPRVSCKIHPILILIEFLKFLMHTLIRSSRKLSLEYYDLKFYFLTEPNAGKFSGSWK